MLTKKRAFREPVLRAGDFTIPIRRSLKYLGMVLDSHLTFSGHSRAISNKASITASAIKRLMPNIGDPTQMKRALLMSVVDSKLLYAFSVWVDMTMTWK
jgi:hypothetical protein